MAGGISEPEIRVVNSDTIEQVIRNNLPSRLGFGSEIMASNVITPVLDITSAAEGSSLSTDLQQALSFGNATAFDVGNTTTDVASSPGFYRLTGCASSISSSSQANSVQITMTDGVSVKIMYEMEVPQNSGNTVNPTQTVDLIFWLAADITLSITTNSTKAKLVGSIRQVADSNGNPVLPSGFTSL